MPLCTRRVQSRYIQVVQLYNCGFATDTGGDTAEFEVCSSVACFLLLTLIQPRASLQPYSNTITHTRTPPFKKMTDDTVYATLNGVPKELLDDVIDSIPHTNLKQCSLVRKCWVYRCQERLFERFTLSAQMTEWWTKPVRENQPLLFLYIKRLTLVGVYPPNWMDVNSA